MNTNAKALTSHFVSLDNSVKRILFYTSLLLLAQIFLAHNSAHASVKQTPNLMLHQQATTIRSFHETTELAENLWADLTNRFVSLYEQGDYQNAYKIAQRSLDIASNNFGMDDVNTADSLLKLGIVAQTLGKMNEAEDNLLGSLVILEDQLSPDHPDVAVALTNLGNVYFEMQQPDKSEKYHRKALQIRLNAFGPNNSSVAQSMYNLAILYENEKKYDEAAKLYTAAINSWSLSVGPAHPYVRNALNNLANVYAEQGKYKQAATVLLRTIALKKSIFGARHEEVAQSLISLGSTYLEQGKYNPASNAYEEALDIARHILKSSDPQLAVLMYTLANIYHTQAQIEEKKLAMPSQPGGSQDDSIRTTTLILGENNIPESTEREAAKKQSLFEQALPLYEKAVEILDDGETETQPVLDVVLTELAMLYKEIGNEDMASATESRIATH